MYYSPAFIRNNAPKQTLEAMRVLAEVYRRARELWPLRPSKNSDHSVTIRIDQLKELSVTTIVNTFGSGNTWLLVRKNDREALVEQHTQEGAHEIGMQGIPYKILKFYRLKKADDGGPDGSRGSRLRQPSSDSRASRQNDLGSNGGSDPSYSFTNSHKSGPSPTPSGKSNSKASSSPRSEKGRSADKNVQFTIFGQSVETLLTGRPPAHSSEKLPPISGSLQA